MQRREYPGGATATQGPGCATLIYDPGCPCASLAGRPDAHEVLSVLSGDGSEPSDQQSIPSFPCRFLRRRATLKVAERIVMMRDIAQFQDPEALKYTP